MEHRRKDRRPLVRRLLPIVRVGGFHLPEGPPRLESRGAQGQSRRVRARRHFAHQAALAADGILVAPSKNSFPTIARRIGAA
jgi:hypothetical protein